MLSNTLNSNTADYSLNYTGNIDFTTGMVFNLPESFFLTVNWGYEYLDYSINNLDKDTGSYFSDVNKDWDGDWSLCWAATDSNILQWGGWGENADNGFAFSENIFDYFKNIFLDAPGRTDLGAEWFINGYNEASFPAGGNFYDLNVSVDGLIYSHDFMSGMSQSDANSYIETIKSFLAGGSAVGLGIIEAGKDVGHAITAWGYDTDSNGDIYIYYTDSDNSYPVTNYNAPKVLQKCKIYYDEASGKIATYEPGWNLMTISALKQYDSIFIGGTETFADARVLYNDDIRSGKIDLPSSSMKVDVDFYKFTAESSCSLTIDLGVYTNLTTGTGVALTVYDMNQNVLETFNEDMLHHYSLRLKDGETIYIEVSGVFAGTGNGDLGFSSNMYVLETTTVPDENLNENRFIYNAWKSPDFSLPERSFYSEDWGHEHLIQEKNFNKPTGTYFADVNINTTEKVVDSQMGWAAIAANALQWTGWGAAVTSKQFATEDDIYKYYFDTLGNKSGDNYNGIRWFLEGSSAIGTGDGFFQKGISASVLHTKSLLSLDLEAVNQSINEIKQNIADGRSVIINANGLGLSLWGYENAADGSLRVFYSNPSDETNLQLQAQLYNYNNQIVLENSKGMRYFANSVTVLERFDNVFLNKEETFADSRTLVDHYNMPGVISKSPNLSVKDGDFYKFTAKTDCFAAINLAVRNGGGVGFTIYDNSKQEIVSIKGEESVDSLFYRLAMHANDTIFIKIHDDKFTGSSGVYKIEVDTEVVGDSYESLTIENLRSSTSKDGQTVQINWDVTAGNVVKSTLFKLEYSKNADFSGEVAVIDGIYGLAWSMNIKEFGEYYFRVASYDAYTGTQDAYINAAAPFYVSSVAPEITASTEKITNQPVFLTATFADDASVKEYSFDNKNWIAYVDNVKLEENGTVYFRSKNVYDRVSIVSSYTVSWIDKVAPDKPIFTLDIEDGKFTNQPVTLKVAPAADAVKVTYAFLNSSGEATEEQDLPSNGELIINENVEVWIHSYDEAGNESVANYKVKCIDTVAPVWDYSALFKTSVTIKDGYNVKIGWTVPNEANLDYYVLAIGHKEIVINSTDKFEVSHVLINADVGIYEYRIKAVDKAGNESEWMNGERFEIKDITAPEVSIAATHTPYYGLVKWDGSDNVGVVKYDVEYKLADAAEWNSWLAGTTLTQYEFHGADGDYLFRVRAYDEAGNRSEYLESTPAIRVDEMLNMEFAGELAAPMQAIILDYQLIFGRYKLVANGTELKLNGKIELKDANMKTVLSATCKNGVWNSQDALLSAGNYGIFITGNIGDAFDFSLKSTALSIYADNTDDNLSLAGNLPALYAFDFTREDWVGYGDMVDCRKLEVTAAGTYRFALDAANPDAKLKFSITALTNGSEKVLGTFSGNGMINLPSSILLDPNSGSTYFVKVELLNGASGIESSYTISGTADTIFPAADNNNSIENAQNLALGANSGYLGYGDAVDYYFFEVAEGGSYSIGLTSAVSGAVKYTLYRKSDEKLTGGQLIKVFAGKDSGMTLNTSAVKDLLRGTYYLVAESSAPENPDKNSEYNLILNQNAAFVKLFDGVDITDFADGDSEKYTFELSDYQKLTFTSIAGITLYQDNGKNGAVKIAPVKNSLSGLYEIDLAKGNYYLTTVSAKAAEVAIISNLPEYEFAIVTDNNTIDRASLLAMAVDNAGWVGFGDGCDFYRFDVTGETAGTYQFKVADSVFGNTVLTVYQQLADAKGNQILVKVAMLKPSENADTLEIENVLAGTYFVSMESLNYSSAAKALNSSYNLQASFRSYNRLGEANAMPSYMVANGLEAYLKQKEMVSFAVDGRTDLQLVKFLGYSFNIYKDTGSKKLEKMNVFDGMVVLEKGVNYYLQSTVDGNKIRLDYCQDIDNNDFSEPNFSITIRNRSLMTPINNWVGYTDASDEYYFSTVDDVESGYAKFQIDSIANPVAKSTKMTLKLFKEVNGKWVASGSNVYTYDTEKGLSGKVLETILAQNSNYKLVVETSDKGKGLSVGDYQLSGTVDEFDFSNNSFFGAQDIVDSTYGALAAGGDTVDFYKLNAPAGSMNLQVIEGKVKVSFYNADCKLLGKASAVSGSFASNIDPNASFVKIESANKGDNRYMITLA